MNLAKKVIFLGILAGLLVVEARIYLGYHYFYKYKEERGRAKSIEGSFERLEADLKKAGRLFGNPSFYKELGQLYFERALGENKFGSEERRDFYLDRARESLIQAVKANPVDAFVYYDLGKVYLLYNYPLLTYLDKAKAYFRKALEFKPADEFLNVNIIFIYLTQWDSLQEGEKDFVLKRIGEARMACQNFVPRLRKRWRDEFGKGEKGGRLEKILELAGIDME